MLSTMKKLLTLPLEKTLIFCGFALGLTLASFWHYNQNVVLAEKTAAFQQGMSTCFSRVNQSFTAAMIRDMSSPYLNKDFMRLSEECVREGAKVSGVDITTMPKVGRLHNEFISEIFWFHEKILKVLGDAPIGARSTVPLNAISEKYSKIESMRLDLADQLDINMHQLHAMRLRDEYVVSGAFLLLLLGCALLAAKEMSRLKTMRELEREALSLLNTGNVDVGAMVDQLVGRSLVANGMPVTHQVFRDYHREILETEMQSNPVSHTDATVTTEPVAPVMASTPAKIPTQALMNISAARGDGVEVRKLLVHQAAHLKMPMNFQDAQVLLDEETTGQILQAIAQRFSGWNARLNGIRVGDTYEIRIEGDGLCLNSNELEYASRIDMAVNGVDVNIVMAIDLAREEGLTLRLKNRQAEDGSIAGAEAILEIPAVSNRSLTNVVRGKKRDLERQLGSMTN